MDRAPRRGVSSLRLIGSVFVANRYKEPELPDTSERMSRDIRAAGRITEIFGELFFAAVRIGEARADRYPCH